MRLALAQINTVVGDLDGNRALILARLDEARAAGAGLVLFPELAVTSYRRRTCSAAGVRARGAAVARRDRRGHHGRDGARRVPPLRRRPLQRVRGLLGRRDRRALPKRFLPNYGVFDEQRYFASARDLLLLRSARPRRPDDLRGHVAARPARDRPRARGRPAPRQHLGVALPRGEGARARGDVPAAGARQAS